MDQEEAEWVPTGEDNYDVLDHGYVKVIESWGSDERIIESARMSTAKGFLRWDAGACPMCEGSGLAEDGEWPCLACEGKGEVPGDARLLRRLYLLKHSTPFEFAGVTIEVQAPLLVFREWQRHRTQSYSELSARYTKMPDLHYVPSVDRIIASAKKSANKQASGAGALYMPGAVDPSNQLEAAKVIQGLIRSEQFRIYALYEELLSFGVAKEVARIDTPVSRYSRMRATCNLRNWLGFLTLRQDRAAQFEIRQFAHAVAHAVSKRYPRTYEIFDEARRG